MRCLQRKLLPFVLCTDKETLASEWLAILKRDQAYPALVANRETFAAQAAPRDN